MSRARFEISPRRLTAAVRNVLRGLQTAMRVSNDMTRNSRSFNAAAESPTPNLAAPSLTTNLLEAL